MAALDFVDYKWSDRTFIQSWSRTKTKFGRDVTGVEIARVGKRAGEIQSVADHDFYLIGRELDAMAETVARKFIVSGLREGAKVVKAAAVSEAPVRRANADEARYKKVSRHGGTRGPGYLRRSIIYRTDPKRVAYRPIVRVGPRSSAFYGEFFEAGRRSARMPTRKWLSRAFARSYQGATERISEKLWELIRTQGRAE